VNPSPHELALVSSRVVTPGGERAAAVVIREDRIAAILPPTDLPAGLQQVSLGDLAVLPGLIDPHVHLNEPGRTHWEGFETGTAAAAVAGITTLVDMPLNSDPVTTSVAALAEKRRAAAGKLAVDVGFYAGLVPGSESSLGDLLDEGVLGVKAFLCDSGLAEFPPVTEVELNAVMPLLAQREVPLLVHAELSHPVPAMSDPTCYADYAATRPPTFERRAIELLIKLCEQTRCRVHIVHLADALSLPALRAARARGLPITVETCPHYLTFAAEEIPSGGTLFKCAPPIRSAGNREALWEGLAEGVIDLIATDHSPCPPENKAIDSGRFDEAWGGISSLQLSLAAVWTAASQRGFTLVDVVRWMSAAPARLLGLAAGLAVGQPAHLVVFDADARFTVAGEALRHRHKLTPYEGRSLRGMVRATYVRGELSGPGRGRLI
jgi:allantoinase